MDVNPELSYQHNLEAEHSRDNLAPQKLPDVDLSLINNREVPASNEVNKKIELEHDAILSELVRSSAQSTQLGAKSFGKQDDSQDGQVKNEVLATPDQSLPAQASNNDQIEREWVDVIKDILLSTANNPYDREERIKDLRDDYILKRYGQKNSGESKE